jgi:hypothetical protein
MSAMRWGEMKPWSGNACTESYELTAIVQRTGRLIGARVASAQ